MGRNPECKLNDDSYQRGYDAAIRDLMPLKKFKPYAHINKHGGTLEVYLEDVSAHHEWIKGEGVDISVIRANDNNRVVGAILPLPKNFEGFEVI